MYCQSLSGAARGLQGHDLALLPQWGAALLKACIRGNSLDPDHVHTDPHRRP